MKILSIVLSILIIMSSSNAFAHENATVDKVEKYLNKLTTLKANFTQTHNGGGKIKGTFMLNRPGKLRFEYAAPLKDFIVADGSYIHFYDGEMKQQSSTSIENSLANFFLRDNIEVSGDINISNIKEDGKNIELTITKNSVEEAGSISLFLTKNPIRLKSWEILDAQGIITKIALSNIQENVKLDENLFYYYDPEKKKLNVNR